MLDDIYIIGAYVTPFQRWPERSVKDLTREAVNGALIDAAMHKYDLDSVWFSNTRQAMLEGQNTIKGQAALRPLGIDGIPIFNVENACASGSSALYLAATHIQAGFGDFTMAVGAEKMFFPGKREQMFAAFMGGTDIEKIEETAARMERLGAHLIPKETQPASERSFFMDVYAGLARKHMETFGTTRRQLAAAASKAHFHSTLNPKSQYQHEISVEQVLADKPIVWPLTRAMCAPVSDGAAAIILARGNMLNSVQKARAVRLRGMGVATATDRAIADYKYHVGRYAAGRAYEAAGINPKDIDVVTLHDATAFAEIQQIENLGLCPIGEGGPFTASGATKLGGRVPVNPCGGLMSKGHPVGATGLAQIEELVLQLRGEAGARQVEGAKLAVAENGGGNLGIEEAVTVVSVLSK